MPRLIFTLACVSAVILPMTDTFRSKGSDRIVKEEDRIIFADESNNVDIPCYNDSSKNPSFISKDDALFYWLKN